MSRATISPAVRDKLRELLEQARVARAMARAAYDRHRELAEELVDAERDVTRLRGGIQRSQWAGGNFPGRAAPGAREPEDQLRAAEARADRLRRQAGTAARSKAEADKIATELARPLERIATHLRADQLLGGSQDPVRNLEDLVA